MLEHGSWPTARARSAATAPAAEHAAEDRTPSCSVRSPQDKAGSSRKTAPAGARPAAPATRPGAPSVIQARQDAPEIAPPWKPTSPGLRAKVCTARSGLANRSWSNRAPDVPAKMNAVPGLIAPMPIAPAGLSPAPPAIIGYCLAMPQPCASLRVNCAAGAKPSTKPRHLGVRERPVAARSSSDQLIDNIEPSRGVGDILDRLAGQDQAQIGSGSRTSRVAAKFSGSCAATQSSFGAVNRIALLPVVARKAGQRSSSTRHRRRSDRRSRECRGRQFEIAIEECRAVHLAGEADARDAGQLTGMVRLQRIQRSASPRSTGDPAREPRAKNRERQRLRAERHQQAISRLRTTAGRGIISPAATSRALSLTTCHVWKWQRPTDLRVKITSVSQRAGNVDDQQADPGASGKGNGW